MSDGNRNDIAKFVIPAVFAFMLLSMIDLDGVPAWLMFAGGVAGVVLIASLVGFLILRQTGWPELARRYPAHGAHAGVWRTCRTAVMSAVSRDSPDYRRRKMLLFFLLRVGSDERALHLSVPALLSRLLPPLRIPWAAVANVHHFDASGRPGAQIEAGSLFNYMYDPGYTGSFLEIEIAEPTCFVQVPAHLFSEMPRSGSPA